MAPVYVLHGMCTRSIKARIGAGVLLLVGLAVTAVWIVHSPRARLAPATLAQLDKETAVIGVTVGGQSRAYPLQALLGVEVTDQELGGQPIVVTF